MSQIIKNLLGGPVPPAVPTSFTTDLLDLNTGPSNPPLGVVVPQANILRVAGDNGIKSVETSIPGDLVLRFVRGSTVTVGAVTQTAVTQAILVGATMTIQIIVAGFSADNLGVSAYATAGVKNVGGVLSIINTVDVIINKDVGLDAVNVTVTTSGSNLLVNVVGVTGKTITWTACLPGIVTSS